MSRDLRSRVIAVLRRHGFGMVKFREMPAGVPGQLLRPGVTVRYPADRQDEVSVSIVQAPRPQGEPEDRCASCGAPIGSAEAACNPFGCAVLVAMAAHLREAKPAEYEPAYVVRVEMEHDRLIVSQMTEDHVSTWLDNVERESERLAEEFHWQQMDEAFK